MPKNDALNYLKENNIWIKGICTILIIVYILFPFLDNQLSNSFILKKNLSEYYSFRYVYWLIFSAIVFYNIYCLFIRKYVYSKFYLFTTTVFSISYIFIRFDDSLRTNIKFSEFDRYLNLPFYYLDILLFILLFNIFHLIIRSCEEIFPKSEIIYFSDSNDDDEILNDDDNVYELQKYIDKISDLVLGQSSKNTFTISINSVWGSGKTYFLNKLEKKLDTSKNVILIKFNPWEFDDSQSIIKEYFNLIGKKLNKYDGNSSKAFNNYCLTLFNYGGVNMRSLAEGISEYVFGNNQNYYETTKKIINNLNKKVVVTIDDLDRLREKEIYDTIKLIRNLSNYSNFYIICNVDHFYLEKEGKIDEKYLEKIFNLQINLPLLSTTTLDYFFDESISQILDDKSSNIFIKNKNLIFNELPFLSEFLNINSHTENLISLKLSLNHFLENRRQVKRFINFLKFYNNEFILDNKLSLNKYILLNLLFFKYPFIRNHFIDENLKLFIKIENSKYKFDLTQYLNFVDKFNNELKIKDKSIIVYSLHYLFNSSNEKTDLTNMYYYQFYFNNQFSTEALGIKDIIENFQKSTLLDVISKNKLIDKGFVKDVLLGKIEEFNNEKLLDLLQFLCNENIQQFSHYDFLIFINSITNESLKFIIEKILNREFLLENSFLKDVIYYYYYLLIDPEKRNGNNSFAVFLEYQDLKEEVKKTFTKEKIQDVLFKDLANKVSNLNYSNEHFNPLESELFYSYNFHMEILNVNTFYPEVKRLLKKLLKDVEFRTYIILCYNFNDDSKRIFKIYSMLMMDNQEQKDFEEIANLGVIYGFDKIRNIDIVNQNEMIEHLKIINRKSFIIYDLDRLKSLFNKIKNENLSYVSYVENIKKNNLEKFKTYLGIQD